MAQKPEFLLKWIYYTFDMTLTKYHVWWSRVPKTAVSCLYRINLKRLTVAKQSLLAMKK